MCNTKPTTTQRTKQTAIILMKSSHSFDFESKIVCIRCGCWHIRYAVCAQKPAATRRTDVKNERQNSLFVFEHAKRFICVPSEHECFGHTNRKRIRNLHQQQTTTDENDESFPVVSILQPHCNIPLRTYSFTLSLSALCRLYSIQFNGEECVCAPVVVFCQRFQPCRVCIQYENLYL